MDARERFSGAAEDYARYRPDYPDEVVAVCAEYAGIAPGGRVADIGSGTGISSRLFARGGYRVTGVEPNDAMRGEAIAAGGGPEYVKGDAAATGLAAASVDLVTCAQALHWIDLDRAIGEWRRILVSGGACAAFWNLRLEKGWQAEYERLLNRYSRDYDGIRHASKGSRGRDGWVKRSPLCTNVAEREMPNAQSFDFPALLGRARSSSYYVHGVDDKPGFERDLRRLFDAHAENGRVEFRYRVSILLWRLAA